MSTPATVPTPAVPEERYDQFAAAVRSKVAALGEPLFTTDVRPDALWDAYLDGLPVDRRQHYRCQSCRRFVHGYGGLVTIDAGGRTAAALWDVDVPPFFAPSARALRTLVAKGAVTGVFLTSETVWGRPVTGAWTHLSGQTPSAYFSLSTSAHQKMAERREEHRTLAHGLAEYPKAAVDQALRVLQADALDRSEKTLGVARWLAGLHGELLAHPATRANLTWRAVATAPPGWCHVRSSMIGTLLDDVVAGLPFDDVARRWAAKMHPLRYQRPTAAPSAGTIEQAERLVAKLGVAASLNRRFATLDDVLTKLWVPPPPPASRAAGQTGGVFGHLRPGSPTPVPPLDLPRTSITWAKFSRTVLPTAATVQVQVPARGNFYGLLTAADAAAPPILQWDGLTGLPRNPASIYVYTGGSTADQWKLTPGWADVAAVFPSPAHWQDPARFAHHSSGAFFAIPGCQDTRLASSALFPETLKADFHGIRSVIEAHSRATPAAGADRGSANGLAFHGTPLAVRVTAPGGTAEYLLDRWE